MALADQNAKAEIEMLRPFEFLGSAPSRCEWLSEAPSDKSASAWSAPDFLARGDEIAEKGKIVHRFLELENTLRIAGANRVALRRR